MRKTKYDNIEYMQSIFKKFIYKLQRDGCVTIYKAYKKPSAEKIRAWNNIIEKYGFKDKCLLDRNITVMHAGCQMFSVGIMLHDIFIYINRYNTIYYKLNNTRTRILYRVKDLEGGVL